jgi:CubicO group peptidase (beta-lactamase class C family)
VNQADFDELIRRIDFDKDPDGKGIAIDALAISDGASEFAHVFTVNGRELHELRSLSKLIVSLCTGIAIDSGRFVVDNDLLGLDTRIWSTFREKVNLVNVLNIDHLEKITVRDLLTQTTGYSNDELMVSSWLKNRNVGDLLDVVLNEPIEAEPGKLFVYSNASAFLLSAFFQEIAGESLYEAAQRDLFAPLGILDHAWMSYGTYSAGATGLYLLIEDVHKLGRLMLQRGVWQGRQIVPEWFVGTMIKKHVDIFERRWREHALSPTGYGFLVWITKDGYYLSGARGQYLIVEPEKEIVISVLSNQETSGRVLDCIRDVL